MTHRHPLPLRRLLAAATAAVLAGALASPLAAAAATGVPTDPNDGVPRVDPPVTYAKFEPLADPGRGSADYFQPKWYDTDGRHIQAHGGQVVTTQEDGQTVYYWYGEDRTNGYWNSPGVAVYRSTDAMNWTNLGDALRSITTRDDLLTPYFENLYDTVDENGQPRNEKIDALAYHLNSQRSADYTAIFERPKVLHNDATGQWVMWWHADGRTEPGGSTYARSMAAVAVSDSPTGPFRMVGAYRMPNRTDYKGCSQYAVPGQARDMTVFQDDDGKAYISYSSEENSSLYIAELDDSYTNVVKTTDSDTLDVHQYSEDGRYPYVFADGTADAPVRGEDFQIVKECGYLEAPAIFERDGTYTAIASGATGWAPNPQTYYTAQSLMGTWIRGVQAGDANENTWYASMPDGSDGLLSVGDTNRSTFGSQSTNVFELEPGKFVYMGDRWNEGQSDSTYVWLPLTVGENGRLEMHNPAAEDPARYGDGWDASYWDDKGFGHGTWSLTPNAVPETVRRGTTANLPATVNVDSNGTVAPVAVTWSAVDTSVLGPQTVTGTLAADADFTAGRSFQRTITVTEPGIADIASEATVSASSRNDLVGTIVDGNPTGKGWDDWTGNGYPRDSWLQFDWGVTRTFDSIVVHTYKDGSTATWPSRIQAQYRDSSGAWVDTEVGATLAQDATQAAPVAVIDARTLPAASALRLRLTSEANTWQSIAEVDVWGNASIPNVCRGGDATVSASFHQTKWATMPAANACDGKQNTQWSTWTDAGFRMPRPSRSRRWRSTASTTSRSPTSRARSRRLGRVSDSGGRVDPGRSDRRRSRGRERHRDDPVVHEGARHGPASDLRDPRVVPEDPGDRRPRSRRDRGDHPDALPRRAGHRLVPRTGRGAALARRQRPGHRAAPHRRRRLGRRHDVRGHRRRRTPRRLPRSARRRRAGGRLGVADRAHRRDRTGDRSERRGCRRGDPHPGPPRRRGSGHRPRSGRHARGDGCHLRCGLHGVLARRGFDVDDRDRDRPHDGGDVPGVVPIDGCRGQRRAGPYRRGDGHGPGRHRPGHHARRDRPRHDARRKRGGHDAGGNGAGTTPAGTGRGLRRPATARHPVPPPAASHSPGPRRPSPSPCSPSAR